MQVNVLGTLYEIHTDTDVKDDKRIEDCDGFCDFTTKDIFLARFDSDPNTMKDMALWGKKVLRHEIIHAFLYESGIDCNSDWGRNEEIVDWIALQFPKLAIAFDENEPDTDDITFKN